jgi:hypothetical protein
MEKLPKVATSLHHRSVAPGCSCAPSLVGATVLSSERRLGDRLVVHSGQRDLDFSGSTHGGRLLYGTSAAVACLEQPARRRTERLAVCGASGLPVRRAPGEGENLRPDDTAEPASAVAVNSYIERCTDFTHTVVAEPSETLHQDGNRDTLDRVEVDRRPLRHWIVSRLDDNLAGETANCGGTRRDERAFQARNRRITREHDDRSPTDVG